MKNYSFLIFVLISLFFYPSSAMAFVQKKTNSSLVETQTSELQKQSWIEKVKIGLVKIKKRYKSSLKNQVKSNKLLKTIVIMSFILGILCEVVGLIAFIIGIGSIGFNGLTLGVYLVIIGGVLLGIGLLGSFLLLALFIKNKHSKSN